MARLRLAMIGGLIVVAVSLTTASAEPGVRGFADIHNHQFANLAFGGQFIVGQAYGPVTEALSPFLDFVYHGPAHEFDIMGSLMATRGPVLLKYPNVGAPDFSGWPNFWEVTHQKVYEDWLYHAVQGGCA